MPCLVCVPSGLCKLGEKACLPPPPRTDLRWGLDADMCDLSRVETLVATRVARTGHSQARNCERTRARPQGLGDRC